MLDRVFGTINIIYARGNENTDFVHRFPILHTHFLVFLLFTNVLNYCSLGQQFATVEAMTIIAMMLSKFTIELVNPDKHPQYGVSLSMPMLEGLPIRIHHRADKARSPTEREEK